MLAVSSQADLLSRLLQVSELRQRTVSQNLANVNTPGYKRLAVRFEDELAQCLSQGQPHGASALEPVVVQPTGSSERADGNNVDIDIELGELQRNALLYQTYTQLLNSQFGTMRRAISGE